MLVHYPVRRTRLYPENQLLGHLRTTFTVGFARSSTQRARYIQSHVSASQRNKPSLGGGQNNAVDAVVDARERLGVDFVELQARRVVACLEAGVIGHRAACSCIRAAD